MGIRNMEIWLHNYKRCHTKIMKKTKFIYPFEAGFDATFDGVFYMEKKKYWLSNFNEINY